MKYQSLLDDDGLIYEQWRPRMKKLYRRIETECRPIPLMDLQIVSINSILPNYYKRKQKND